MGRSPARPRDSAPPREQGTLRISKCDAEQCAISTRLSCVVVSTWSTGRSSSGRARHCGSSQSIVNVRFTPASVTVNRWRSPSRNVSFSMSSDGTTSVAAPASRCVIRSCQRSRASRRPSARFLIIGLNRGCNVKGRRHRAPFRRRTMAPRNVPNGQMTGPSAVFCRALTRR